MNRTLNLTRYISGFFCWSSLFRPVPHPNNSPSRKVKPHSYPASWVSRWTEKTIYPYWKRSVDGWELPTGMVEPPAQGPIVRVSREPCIKMFTINPYNARLLISIIKTASASGNAVWNRVILSFSTSPSGRKEPSTTWVSTSKTVTSLMPAHQKVSWSTT